MGPTFAARPLRGTNVSTLLEFKTADRDPLLVEVEEPSGGPVTRGGRTAEAVVEAGASLEQVLARLLPALRGIISQLREAAEWPGTQTIIIQPGAEGVDTERHGSAVASIVAEGAIRWPEPSTIWSPMSSSRCGRCSGVAAV
jgi:hypothetical protein